jgi:ABC-type amino acid transport substrate-binding protein
MMVSLGLFVLMRSPSRMAAVTAAQPGTPDVQANPSLAPGAEVKSDVAKAPRQRTSAPVRPEDDELNKLRKRRIDATASDRSAILQAFARAEKQYPNDYRFPYERAKLAVMGPQSRSHDEAFNALSLAAEKAINSGKAREMLDGLEADKSGDFHKLSHGHHEWNQLAKALTSKDTRLLSTNAQF